MKTNNSIIEQAIKKVTILSVLAGCIVSSQAQSPATAPPVTVNRPPIQPVAPNNTNIQPLAPNNNVPNNNLPVPNNNIPVPNNNIPVPNTGIPFQNNGLPVQNHNGVPNPNNIPSPNDERINQMTPGITNFNGASQYQVSNYPNGSFLFNRNGGAISNYSGYPTNGNAGADHHHHWWHW